MPQEMLLHQCLSHELVLRGDETLLRHAALCNLKLAASREKIWSQASKSSFVLTYVVIWNGWHGTGCLFVPEVYTFACFFSPFSGTSTRYWSNLLLKFRTFCCTLEPTGASKEFLVETSQMKWLSLASTGHWRATTSLDLKLHLFLNPLLWFQTILLANAHVASDIPQELNKWSGFGCPVSDSLAATTDGSITKQP